jgi:hypothetical protein
MTKKSKKFEREAAMKRAFAKGGSHGPGSEYALKKKRERKAYEDQLKRTSGLMPYQLVGNRSVGVSVDDDVLARLDRIEKALDKLT